MCMDEVLDEAAKRIAAAQKQRDDARREKARARAIIRELLLNFTADYEAEEYHSPKVRAYQRACRFVGVPV